VSFCFNERSIGVVRVGLVRGHMEGRAKMTRKKIAFVGDCSVKRSSSAAGEKRDSLAITQGRVKGAWLIHTGGRQKFFAGL